jgi:hypothetical protein
MKMNGEEQEQKPQEEEFERRPEKKEILVEGETPIVITGGSVNIEFADQGDDGFEPDNPVPGFKMKLKHKKNPQDKVELTRVQVTTKAGAVLMEIDLRALDKHKNCKVKVFYNLVE